MKQPFWFGGRPAHGDLPGGNTHRSSYHRHFEGYVEYTALNASGKGTHIERVYTAPYHVCALTKGALAVRKAVLALLWLGGMAAFLAGAVRPGTANCLKAAALFQGAVIVLALWLAKGILALLFAPPQMTISEFRGSAGALRTAAPALTAAAALHLLYAAAVTLLYAEPALPLLLPAAGLLLWAALWRIQRGIVWITAENKNRDAEGIPIGAE